MSHKHYKYLILIILVFLFFGCNNSNTLTGFQCENGLLAESCDKKCAKDNGTQYQFNVNKDEKSVMILWIYEGKNVYSHVHEKCKIFDKLNWDCSEENFNTNGYHTRTIFKMANGVFAGTGESSYINKSLDISKDPHEQLYICAK